MADISTISTFNGRINNLFTDPNMGGVRFDGSMVYHHAERHLHVSGTFYSYALPTGNTENWYFPLTSLTSQFPELNGAILRQTGLITGSVLMYDPSTHLFTFAMDWGPLVFVDPGDKNSVQIRRLYDLDTGAYGGWEWKVLYQIPVVVDVHFYFI